MESSNQDRMVPTVIDFEASGFGLDGYPIEVGYSLPDGKRFCALIRPQEDWESWDREAETRHGVARELLQRRGLPAAQLCARLEQDLGGKTVYSDDWSFDLTWLHRLYSAASCEPGFRLESLRVLLTEKEAEHWHMMLSAIRHDFAGARHRASIKAATTQKALCKLMGLEPPKLNDEIGLAG